MKKLLRKRTMFLVALLVGLCMPVMAQTETNSTKSTFNVASVPVEGVPQTARESFLFFFSYNVALKQNALAEEGTKKLSLSISKQDWSVIGLFEDYNYHTQLMNSLGTTYSSYAKNDAGITNSDRRNSTDGLGILVKKDGYTLGSPAGFGAQWSGGSGAGILEYTTNGNLDALVYRGYRCWPVTLPNGAVIDVYTFHLDAGVAQSSSDYNNGEDKNLIARRNQLANLVAAIKTNAQNNKRPAIVMGLTNTLYTSEDLKKNLIDAVNGVEGLTINDAWVELMRGGKYPTYPSADETPGSFYFNDQNGEVINKVFYINNNASNYTIKANSYYRNIEDFDELDHEPVVVNFTVAQKGVEDENVTIEPDSWVIPESNKPATETPGAVLGEVVTSGTQYFIKNVSSGHFLMAGADWGARACEGSAAMPITITKQGNVGSTYTLATLQNFVFVAENNAERVFMDGGDSNAGNNYWVLEEVDGSKTTINGTSACQYYIYHTTYGALTSTGSGEYGNLVYCTPLDKSNDKQKWVLLTSTNMRKFMSSATVSNPFDITPFMFGGADFGRLLVQKGDASAWGTEKGTDNTKFDFWYNHDGTQHNDGFAFNAIYNYEDSHPAITIDKSLSSMPQGTYHLSFEGFYRARAKTDITGYNKDYVMTIPVTLGANSVNLSQNNEAAWASRTDNWGLNGFLAMFRDGDTYRSEVTTKLNTDGTLNFKFSKPKFEDGVAYYAGSSQDFPRRTLVVLDNFSIKYFGNSADNSVKILIYNYLQETAAKVALLNEAGQAAYDVSEVIRRYNSNTLSADGSVEIAMIDLAYDIALRAHNAKEAEDALDENNGDITSLIVNPSFEQGITGWTVGAGWDCGVRDNNVVDANGDFIYYVDNAHSDVLGEGLLDCQLYNGYAGEGMLGAWPVTQTITGLKNGLYELKALVTSFKGNTVYILGNDYHAGVEVKTGKTHFEEATLLFMVEDGTAKIGAMGGSFGGYYYTEGCFYKADNFRLRYICDPAHGRVYLAHQEATAVLETLDGTAKDYAAVTTTADDRLGELLERYKNADSRQIAALVNTDGTAAASAIYAALTNTALQQKAVGSDMTWCIKDPSFELGKYVDGGWSRLYNADVRAAKQNDETYKAVGTMGSYLFNAWDNNNIASPLTYTINDIPNGTYRLTAKVTSDAGNKVFLTAGSVQSSIEATNVTEGTDYIEQSGEVPFSSLNNKRLEVENEAGKIICQSSVDPYNNSQFRLGKNGTLTITVEPNTDETLVITEVIITYFSSYYTGSFSGATQNTTDKTWTKSGLNTTSVEFKNSSSNTARITNITVKYKRQYHVPHVVLPAKHMMRDISLDFEVTGGNVTIGVAGGKDGVYTATDGCWYKADDFHLQLLFPKEDNQQSKTLYLSENATYMPDVDFSRDAQSRSQYGNIYGYSKVTVERTLTHGSWGTLLLPFDLPIANLGDGNWDVRELSESENETDDVVVTFTTPANGKIKAGKCYIVRHNSQDLSTIEIDVDDETTFITTADYFDTSCGAEGNNQMVEFIGTYTRGYVPVGSFFINSKNQFKEVVKANTNKIKGFRGYFTVKSEAKGRALSFRLGEGTGVDSANNGEVTVVAIYNLQGMRLNDMEPGINILQMSDGSSVKVLIK